MELSTGFGRRLLLLKHSHKPCCVLTQSWWVYLDLYLWKVLVSPNKWQLRNTPLQSQQTMLPYPYTKPNLDNIKRLYYKIWMLLMNDVQLDLQHHWTYRNWYSSHRESAFFFSLYIISHIIKLFQGHFSPIICYRVKIQVGLLSCWNIGILFQCSKLDDSKSGALRKNTLF